MNTFKKLALSLLLAMPMVASAAGMGVYIPLNLTEKEELEYVDYTGTYEFNYKPSAGLGITFDSNIGKDKLYNYRFGFEYSKATTDNEWWGESVGGAITKEKYNFVNTFGFGVVRTKTVRLWIGPRINIQFENGTNEDTSLLSVEQSSFGIGIGAALGLNVNLGRTVSLAADLDYHAVSIVGTEDGTALGIPFSDEYSGINSGATARFYVLFRFGETFNNTSSQAANQGVIDQSL